MVRYSAVRLEQEINRLSHQREERQGLTGIEPFVPQSGMVLSTPAALITGVGFSAAMAGAFEAGRSQHGDLPVSIAGVCVSVVYTCMNFIKRKSKDSAKNHDKGKDRNNNAVKDKKDSFYLD